MNQPTPKPADKPLAAKTGPENPARRQFVARLSRTAAVAVPLAMVASMGLPKAHAY
jgi:hypothetical protein